MADAVKILAVPPVQSVYYVLMMRRLLLIPLFTVLLCQCQSTHTVTGDGLAGGNVEFDENRGREKLMEKFAGGWKPEDASWYAASGEDKQKKVAKLRQESKRSQFENLVSKSRKEVMFSKNSRWDERSIYNKEYAGKTKQKGFAWPWEKKYKGSTDRPLETEYQRELPIPKESLQVAKEADLKPRESEKEYATTEYDTRKPDLEHKENWPGNKPSAHRPIPILEDRSKAKEDNSSWSLSDVRKLLNKS